MNTPSEPHARFAFDCRVAICKAFLGLSAIEACSALVLKARRFAPMGISLTHSVHGLIVGPAGASRCIRTVRFPVHSYRQGVNWEHNKKIDRRCDQDKREHGVDKIADRELAAVDLKGNRGKIWFPYNRGDKRRNQILALRGSTGRVSRSLRRIANIKDCLLEGVEFELSSDFLNGQ